MGFKHQAIPVLHLRARLVEVLCRPSAGMMIPAVGEQDPPTSRNNVVIGIHLRALHADVQVLCLLLRLDLPISRRKIVTEDGHTTCDGQACRYIYCRKKRPGMNGSVIAVRPVNMEVLICRGQ